jgi:hypothetical protein
MQNVTKPMQNLDKYSGFSLLYLTLYSVIGISSVVLLLHVGSARAIVIAGLNSRTQDNFCSGLAFADDFWPGASLGISIGAPMFSFLPRPSYDLGFLQYYSWISKWKHSKCKHRSYISPKAQS